jgi:hypothetical protein
VAEVHLHTVGIIEKSLVAICEERTPRSDAERTFRRAFVQWAVCRLVRAPPRPDEAQAAADQLQGLGQWMHSQLQEQLPSTDANDCRPLVEDATASLMLSATTFLTGSVLRPLSQGELMRVQAAFSAALTSTPERGARASVLVALGALSVALHGTAAADRTAAFPPDLQDLWRRYVAAERDLAERESLQRERDAMGQIVSIEPEDEVRDAMSWALISDALALADVLAGDPRNWSWVASLEVRGPDGPPVGLALSRTPDGMWAITSVPWSDADRPLPEPWRWRDVDLAITRSDLIFRRPVGQTMATAPLPDLPVTDTPVVHFADETWAGFLALQWRASQVFWEAASGALDLGAAQGSHPRQLRLPSPVGLAPFCSEPSVAALHVEADRLVRLVDIDGSVIGSMSVELAPAGTGGVRVAVISLVVPSRTVLGSAPMRVARSLGAPLGEEVWCERVRLPTRRTTFGLRLTPAGSTVVTDAHVYDEQGAEVVRLSVR